MVEQQIRPGRCSIRTCLICCTWCRARSLFFRSIAARFFRYPPPARRNESMWEPQDGSAGPQELTVRRAPTACWKCHRKRLSDCAPPRTARARLLGRGEACAGRVRPEQSRAPRRREHHAGSRRRGARWSRHAPYEVIVLTGSSPLLPRAFLEQLAVGGRLFAVTGEAPAMSARLVVCTAPGAYHSTDLFEDRHRAARQRRAAAAVPLLEKQGFARVHNDPAVPVY